ncbi:MAG: hypothetical protein K4304_03110 [Propionicimonas sp.]
MPIEKAVEVLRQFVIRAVHISTHSLTADRENLERLAQGAWRVTFALDQTATVERDIPDEERMESLASRVRPLTLATEPIHHRKVMKAIKIVIAHHSADALTSRKTLIDALVQQWHKYGLDQDSLSTYTESLVNIASGEPAAVATDVQLAAGWFYADVAHATPTGWKADALLFPRATRYQAAVPRWSMLAVTALRTLDLVQQLRDDGILVLPDDAFTPDLAITKRTAVETVVMVAPPGAPLPGVAGTAPGPEYVRLNVGKAARLYSNNRVHITLARDGQETLRRPAAVLNRSSPDEDPFEMDVLVDEAIVFHVVVHTNDPGRTQQAGIETVWQTNRALSDGLRLLNSLHSSDTLIYTTDDGTPLLTYNLSAETSVPSQNVTTEFINDIAIIESLLNVRLPLVNYIPSCDVRTAVRVLRLTMEGELVSGPFGPIEVTMESEGKPQAIQLKLPPLGVGEITTPERTLLMWHPRASIDSLGEPGEYRVTPPVGEQFLVWDPAKRDMGPDSDFTPTAHVNV